MSSEELISGYATYVESEALDDAPGIVLPTTTTPWPPTLPWTPNTLTVPISV